MVKRRSIFTAAAFTSGHAPSIAILKTKTQDATVDPKLAMFPKSTRSRKTSQQGQGHINILKIIQTRRKLLFLFRKVRNQKSGKKFSNKLSYMLIIVA
jgi:hypothetical protein